MKIPYIKSASRCVICGGEGVIRIDKSGLDWLHPIRHVYRESCEYYLSKKRRELERQQKESSQS